MRLRFSANFRIHDIPCFVLVEVLQNESMQRWAVGKFIFWFLISRNLRGMVERKKPDAGASSLKDVVRLFSRRV